MIQFVRTFLLDKVEPYCGPLVTDIIIIAGIALISLIFYYVTIFVLRIITGLIEKTQTTWDDDLLNDRCMRAISQLSPALIIHWLLPSFFGDDQHRWLDIITSIYIVATVVWLLVVLINNLYDAFLKRPKLHPYAVKGVFQMLELVLICIAIILTVSIIINRSPVAILTALGASAAVLMLVFKDTILGLVASVQLTANKMIQRGDWIVCKSHDANGVVVDISLTTVKVRNWDNTITTIPPYLLVSESFRNYQPMIAGEGRRVDRSVLIDANSVRFLKEDELENLRSKGWLNGLDIADASKVVNLQLLRSYLTKWLKSDERINQNLMVMVRQMEPTSAGLPLQLYFFTKTTVWVEYEKIQSDIFDYVYAVISAFGLRIYQLPTGQCS